MHIERFVVSPIGSNCYVVSESEERGADAVVVDPGDPRLDAVMEYIDTHAFRIREVWATHAHFDHVLGVDVIRRRYGVPAYVHQDDDVVWHEANNTAAMWLGQVAQNLLPPDGFWVDGDTLTLGKASFTIWHTPGHSPGSVCFVNPDIVFTGDMLFAGSIGRTDLPLSDAKAMDSSLRRVRDLPKTAVLYPGHGPQTTILRELESNPFLKI